LAVFCFEITCECGKFAFCFAFWRRGGPRAQVHVRDAAAATEASVDMHIIYAAWSIQKNQKTWKYDILGALGDYFGLIVN
jgi:hypothetical protein